MWLACNVNRGKPCFRDQSIAALTIIEATPRRRNRGSVYIERRYGCSVPGFLGLGWTGWSQTHPPPAMYLSRPSTSQAINWWFRSRVPAQRLYNLSADLCRASPLTPRSVHIALRWWTSVSRSFSVAFRTFRDVVEDGFLRLPANGTLSQVSFLETNSFPSLSMNASSDKGSRFFLPIIFLLG